MTDLQLKQCLIIICFMTGSMIDMFSLIFGIIAVFLWTVYIPFFRYKKGELPKQDVN
jgi:hypothetical protein